MTTFPAAGGRFREERDPWWFVVDPLLILSVMAITAMGALLVYSATRGPATELDPANTSFLTRQVFFAVVGAGLGLFAALINIERIRSLVSVAYISTLGLLLGTLLFGADINGTQAWYRLGGFTFQPSEPGKLVLIVTLATVFSGDRVGFQRMAAGLLLAGVPIGLILLQPDLGTVLVYIVVTAVMIMMSNISMRLILLLVLAAITAITMIFTSDVLEDYQKDRLTVFVLDDEAVAELGADAVRVAYNAEQSQIAIGNGGLTGTGLFQGTQTSSNLVPEQQTDFIFSVAGEELGFRGAAILLVLFAVVVVRIWRVAVRASDEFDRLMAVGVMSMFVFQVFQSAGMTMGMMPVTGIPMPFVSYGGSSMLTSMIAIGLILGVYRRRFDYVRA
ncbi:MAG: FtsW/RodA/SpoVE family cell cycle protein [Actinomycetota bacterium]|nr:FtsW/RodA/SpoVE family cell cycle protein [Actinomycetota bacterium]MEC7968025.1 FtsW/RodA/SpoVE family cell cycle protein [Actinomycetota bacterium]